MANINGEDGQTGSIRDRRITTAAYTLRPSDGGQTLELDPAAAGGAITLTLPASALNTPGPGSYFDLLQISAGTVTIVAEAPATIITTGAAVPTQLNGLAAAATIRRRRNDDDPTWYVGGELA